MKSILANDEYSSWGEWSECTAPCESGSQTRTRKCVSPLFKEYNSYKRRYIDYGCDLLSETRSCNIDQECKGEIYFLTTIIDVSNCGQGGIVFQNFKRLNFVENLHFQFARLSFLRFGLNASTTIYYPKFNSPIYFVFDVFRLL